LDKSEKLPYAQTAREFKGSLGNELPLVELIEIAREYVTDNFVVHGYCAIITIHAGENKDNPSKNNPHVHIIIPFRTLEPDGFSKTKTSSRKWNNRKQLRIWRELWADVQNRAYERNGLNIRISHESNEVQGKDAPAPYKSRIDWQRNKETREIQAQRKARDKQIKQHQLEHEHECEYELSW
jgi:hypothetical protein